MVSPNRWWQHDKELHYSSPLDYFGKPVTPPPTDLALHPSSRTISALSPWFPRPFPSISTRELDLAPTVCLESQGLSHQNLYQIRSRYNPTTEKELRAEKVDLQPLFTQRCLHGFLIFGFLDPILTVPGAGTGNETLSSLVSGSPTPQNLDQLRPLPTLPLRAHTREEYINLFDRDIGG